MGHPLSILIVDDSKQDAELLLDSLKRGGYEPAHEVVDTPEAMRAALDHRDWDVITSDHAMPRFSAPEALAVAKELRPEVPFIIVSGEIDLNLAVSLMRTGAQDYIVKHELPRVVPAIERELREVEVRHERHRAQIALEASEVRYRRLFESAQDGILIVDADTAQISDVNPFLIEMLSYSYDELVGKTLWEIGAFKDVAASKHAFKELQYKGYIRYEDLPLEAKDGRHIAAEFVSNVYSVDHKRVIQCNVRDITTRKRAEAAIQALIVELEQRVEESAGRLEDLKKMARDIRGSLDRGGV